MSQARVLWTGYCILGIAMAILVGLNPNHFTSVDSGYYLQSATNLLAGHGYVVQENGQLIWNSTFPIGYSVLIASVSGLAGLPVLIASKLVNYIAIGLSSYGWVRRLGVSRASWLLAIWGIGSFLKIAVYSWSETVFLVLLAEWIWCLHQFLLKPVTSRSFSLFLIGLSLFLTRYAGGYVVGLTSSLALIVWLFPDVVQIHLDVIQPRSVALTLMAISTAGVVSMVVYFGINQHLSGSFFGGDRFLPTESTSELLKIFGWAVLNECLFIRDFSQVGPNQLAWIGLGVQLVLLGAMHRQLRRNKLSGTKPLVVTSLIRLILFTASSYLLVLFMLRTLSPFSDPNFRLMAPFTFCLLFAISIGIGELPQKQQRMLRVWGLLLLPCSWLQLLPEANLLLKLSQIWSSLAIRLALF
ncbi:hypothetical protein GCM10028808_67390 [Spirosoma migulaei]